MYSFNIIKGGITYTVYLFATFTGHFQPFTPTDPLEFNEIFQPLVEYDSSPYYQGWYYESSSGPRLDKLVKYWLMKAPFQGKFEQPTMPGVYYRRLEKELGQWQAKELITPNAVLTQAHYLRYSINKDGELESAWHVFSIIMDSYSYTYNSNGTLKDTDTFRSSPPTDIPDL